MADIYKLIHPAKYYSDHISQNLRPDGRTFNKFRSLVVNVNSVKTAEASAIAKCGNTTVICGIKLELAVPKVESPHCGYIVTNVELPALCSSQFKPGPPSEVAQVCSNLVSDILIHSKCIDLKSLCIEPDKLVWALYCDMICVDNDGCVVDTCLTALVTSLKSLSLPKVEYDIETEDCVVNEEIKTPLDIKSMPLSTSFAVYDSEVVLADPTNEEEELCGGAVANFTISWCDDVMCGTYKLDGKCLSPELQERALNLGKQRIDLIKNNINAVIVNMKK